MLCSHLKSISLKCIAQDKFLSTKSLKLKSRMSEPTETIDAKISYKQAADYWSNVDPTVDGMLGGFGKISQIDIEGSSKFLKALFKVLLYHPRLISKWRCRISFSSVDILYSDSYYPCNVLYISKLIFLFKEQIIYKWNGFYFQSIRLLVLFFLSWSFHLFAFFPDDRRTW